MRKNSIRVFYSNLKKQNPEPEGELYFINNYTLLVAVVLSAQATDIGVNKATRPLFKKVKSPKRMMALGELELKKYIKTIGLFNSKAKNIIKLSQILLDEHGGKVPENRGELQKLPGVGRKTANVVLNIAFGHPTIAVDTHLFRVGNRTGIARGKTPLEVEKQFEKHTPPEFMLQAHHWLILLGRYVCKARKPDCPNCVVNDVCAFTSKTTFNA
jgi:endonuclease III